MKPKGLYLALCVAGTILPYTQFIPFLREHGLFTFVRWNTFFVNPPLPKRTG